MQHSASWNRTMHAAHYPIPIPQNRRKRTPSPCVKQAHQDMQQSLNAELERLQALKAVNPNIRDEEIESIEEQIKELTGYINQAQVQLDSLRLIVVSHN